MREEDHLQRDLCLNGIIPVNMCYRLISVLPKDVNSQLLVSVNMALFRNRFCVDYCVKMRILGYVLIQYDHVLIKKGSWMDTYGGKRR